MEGGKEGRKERRIIRKFYIKYLRLESNINNNNK